MTEHVWLAGYHGNGYHGAVQFTVSVTVHCQLLVCLEAVDIPLEYTHESRLLQLACVTGVFLPLTHANQLLHLHQYVVVTVMLQ